MKKIILLICVLWNINSYSQNVCPNVGFENSTFTGWSAGTGDCSNYPTPTTWTLGFVSGPINDIASDALSQQDILTCVTCYDPNAGGTAIPYLAPGGGSVSVRLGNSSTNSGTEYLSYQIPVTINNTSFTYQYAVVLEDGSHTSLEQPRFTVNVLDQNGNIINGPCGIYNIETNAASTDPTFSPFYITNVFGGQTLDGYYKPWTSVTIDLTTYIGTTVTIQFITQDCTLGGHYGYAYIDASCSTLVNQILFCPTDTICQIIAPPGFSGYQWYTNLGVAIPNATNETLSVSHPVLGQQFSVSMTNASGCSTTLTTTLAYSTMILYQNTHNSSCGGNDGWAYINQSGVPGPFTYIWRDSINNAIMSQTDSLLNVHSGTYYVTVQNSTGCNSTDTVHILNLNGVVASYNSTPITCHNGTNGSVVAIPIGGQGPFTYQWSNGSTNNSINGLSSGSYCVKITASNGCVDSVCVIILNPLPVIAEFSCNPIETDIINANITFINQSSDSTTYQWLFGDNTTSISQNPTHLYTNVGEYQISLIATNNKGCKDSIIHTVIIDGLFTFYAPNAFTPSKLENSTFLPKGTGWDNSSFRMSIYDRWGNFLFYSDDVTRGWDGTYRGNISQIDVYVWKITLKEINGKEHSYIGRVSLVK